MILITRDQRKALENVGLLQYKRVGINAQDQNFVVVNKDHCSRDKGYYVVESPDVMLFLGHYENFNLQRIRRDQLRTLKTSGLLTDEKMQKWGTYVPNAIAYEDQFGQWRIRKVAQLMFALGIWHQKNK